MNSLIVYILQFVTGSGQIIVQRWCVVCPFHPELCSEWQWHAREAHRGSSAVVPNSYWWVEPRAYLPRKALELFPGYWRVTAGKLVRCLGLLGRGFLEMKCRDMLPLMGFSLAVLRIRFPKFWFSKLVLHERCKIVFLRVDLVRCCRLVIWHVS